ncbi:hypothetical protein RJ641_015705 [Dillenia turbinata]|uniref:Uncharacterized protein n=1 Tax=Dillenia turbinata TaxID=194707 RepID=A0AAN8Z0C2_9MAGN
MKTLFISQDLWELVENGYNEMGVSAKLWMKPFFPALRQPLSCRKHGTSFKNVVKTVKLQTLQQNCKSSFMKDGESLDAYSAKLSKIVNQVQKYGKDVYQQKLVEKFLRSLPKKYDHIVAAIEEVNDLSELTVDELLGPYNLMKAD